MPQLPDTGYRRAPLPAPRPELSSAEIYIKLEQDRKRDIELQQRVTRELEEERAGETPAQRAARTIRIGMENFLKMFLPERTVDAYSELFRDPQTTFHERMSKTPLPSTPFGDDFEPRQRRRY